MAGMETIVAVSVGILATIFLASLVALIVVCKHKFCKRQDHITQQHRDMRIVADTRIYGTPEANRVDPDETAPTGAVSSGSTLFANTSNHVTMRPDVQLIEEDGSRRSKSELELDEVDMSNPKLDEILKDDGWVDDVTIVADNLIYGTLQAIRVDPDETAPKGAVSSGSTLFTNMSNHVTMSGLVPHCISILKTCHHLTERLVGMTMGNSDKIRTQEQLTDIITVAKRINPRVDEVVQSMYPPLDPRLLEARCTALVLSVSHLVLVTKHACKLQGNMDWIDQDLADVEDHLKVLQEASFNLSPDCRTASSSVASADSHQAMVNGAIPTVPGLPTSESSQV